MHPVLKLKAKSLKRTSEVCGSLEKLDLNIGNLDEDIVDGFLFKSFSQASDFPPMQPLFNLEVLSLDLWSFCYYSVSLGEGTWNGVYHFDCFTSRWLFFSISQLETSATPVLSSGPCHTSAADEFLVGATVSRGKIPYARQIYTLWLTSITSFC